MKMLTNAYVRTHKNEIIKEMREGKIFVFPSDRGYCIGCNLSSKVVVEKVRGIVKADEMSCIIPNLDWINRQIEISQKTKEFLGKLPGVFEIKVSLKPESDINFIGNEIGVRMPSHWIYEIIKDAGIAFLCLPARIDGDENVTDFYSIDSRIKEQVDYIINDGSIKCQELIVFDARSVKKQENESREIEFERFGSLKFR
jgi:tRNA A37 threonylcarbamoyladenosine synthetase subunit TsaC/SUA5/YrdC